MLVLFLLCYAIAIASLVIAIAIFSGRKSTNISPEFPLSLVVFIIASSLSIMFFCKYKQNIENDTILKYQLGEYETIEKLVNGEVVDRTYKLIKIDYD